MAKRIFVVEDDQSCEVILRNAIHSIDPTAEVQWEESAEDAMISLEKDFCSGKKYDLIIADIYLAGKHTGLELWETCRDRFPNTPILVTSSMPIGRFFNAIGQNAIAPPFLAKPFYAAECHRMIEGLLSYT